MIQSAHLMTSRLCSMTMSVFPFFTSALKAANSFRISWKCNPVVGSSKIKSVFVAKFPLPKKLASLIRCASPPLSVDELCQTIYPKPTSASG